MSDASFVGSIPQVYDEYMVPLIFEGYAADMARRVAASGAKTVLETAAGSGVVTRQLAQVLPPPARVTVTDINQEMIERAKVWLDGDPRFVWQACDALELPFPDASFDAVVCQFGAMFFPDKVGGYAETRRVLVQGGIFLLNIWDRIEENPFPHAVEAALKRLFPEDPPDFLSRTPHGHGDPVRIRADLGSAGFANVRIERIVLTSSAKTARDVAIAYCKGTPTRHMIDARAPGRIDEVTATVEAAIVDRWGQGPVAAPIAAFVVEARS